MFPEWLTNTTLAIFTVVCGVTIHFFSQKQYHHALWSGVIAFFLLFLFLAAHVHNWITSKEINQAMLPDISIGIFTPVDRDISFARLTPYKYPLDEYNLSISNNNKKSASVSDLTIEFFFPYVITEVKCGPVFDSGGSVTVGRLTTIETQNGKTVVTEDQPVNTVLDELCTLKVKTSKQGDKLINSNIVVFYCKEWPEIAWYGGSIIVDLVKKPRIVIKEHEIGHFTGIYKYKIGNEIFSGKIKGTIPEANIKVKLAEHHWLKGKEYTEHEEFNKAISEFDKALGLCSDYNDAYYDRGYAYSNIAEYEKAISDYSQVIKLSPTYAHAYFNSASSKAYLKRYDEAIIDYSKYVELRPSDPDGFFQRARIHGFKGQYNEAVLDCDKAIELNLPKEQYSEIAILYFNAANFYFRKRNFHQAKDCYDKSIRFNQNYADAYNNRGQVSEILGKTNKAAKDYKKACDLGHQRACAEYHRLKS